MAVLGNGGYWGENDAGREYEIGNIRPLSALTAKKPVVLSNRYEPTGETINSNYDVPITELIVPSTCKSMVRSKTNHNQKFAQS